MSPLSSEVLRDQTAHREHLPLPTRQWLLAQSWHHLLFMHWPVPVELLRPMIPPALTIDHFDGSAWVGVVPFEMQHVHLRGVLELPLLAAFPELNVRTYVTQGGKPGVWFFSLDADHWPAVLVARAAFRLPYFKAEMQAQRRGDTVLYASYRRHPNAADGVFRGAYQPTAEIAWSTPGTLEYFLTERYYLYTVDSGGRLFRGAVQHLPWPLQTAEADIVVNTVAQSQGISLPETAPLLHYAHRLDVLTWPLEQV